MTTTIKKYLPFLAVVIAVSAIAVSSVASAQALPVQPAAPSSSSSTKMHGHFGMRGMHPGVFGTVSAINGTSITVTSTNRKTNAVTTYTINASNATVMKSGTTSSVSAIAVGDTIMVTGTVSGTSVTATKINDGIMPRQNGGLIASTFAGNGSPIVGGTVTAVSGNTITFTNKSNVSYTADATSATITKSGVTSPTVSNISVGDSILVQGTVNGTSIAATTVMDQGIAPSANQVSTGTPQQHSGLFGSVGGFFSKLFGF